MRWILPFAPHVPQLEPVLFWQGECPYIDGKETLTAGASVNSLSQDAYQDLMDKGMRRSGHVIYRPLCLDCRQCQPLRIRVADFKPSKSQKRLLKKYKHQFHVDIDLPQLDEERLALYNRYQMQWHQSSEAALTLEHYYEAFVSSPVETLEIAWRTAQGELVGVGLVDVLPQGFSSVYFYWEPECAQAQLGTLSILQEIEMTQQQGKELYYMGFLVKSCGKMAYKSKFLGAEIWGGTAWTKLPGRDLDGPEVQKCLEEAEKGSQITDENHFPFNQAVRIFSQRR